jgi:hypothetical protein
MEWEKSTWQVDNPEELGRAKMSKGLYAVWVVLILQAMSNYGPF